MSIIKLSELDRDVILNEVPDRIKNMQGVNVLSGAIDYLRSNNLRFNTATGKVFDKTGLKSSINNYKSNPYSHHCDLNSIIYNEFVPWIGNAVSHYRVHAVFA